MNKNQQMSDEECKEVFEYYGKQKDKKSQEQLAAMLSEIQEICGFISPEMAEKAAETAGVKQTVIDSLVRLYPSLKAAPYRHKIVMCTGARCKENGSAPLIKMARELLKTDKNGLSSDKSILLETRDCLKQCKSGPNISVDGEIVNHIGEKELKQVIESLKNKEKALY